MKNKQCLLCYASVPKSEYNDKQAMCADCMKYVPYFNAKSHDRLKQSFAKYRTDNKVETKNL